MTRKIIGVLSTLAIVMVVYGYTRHKPPLPTHDIIAITQIIEHNTLDTVRAGFLKALKENGYGESKIQIVYENAHGNVSTATQIAAHFASLKPKVLVALSTQSAQILSTVSKTFQIPLVFTAVTDPVAAKLIPSKGTPAPLITGVSDFMPAAPQLAMMRKFIPHLKKLGVLHNPSEVNSTSFLKEMERVAARDGIDLVYAPLHATAEATSATLTLEGKVDAIYFPNDNTAMAAAASIAAVGLKHKIPIFCNDEASVERGILAAVSYDRTAMGRKTAEIVIALLEGKKPENIPIVYDTPSDVVVNEHSLNALGIALPKDGKFRLIQASLGGVT